MKKKNWLGFQKKTRLERIDMLKENEIIDSDFENLLKENENLSTKIAEQMIENSIGTFSLPFGVASNFLINDVEYTVPMVTEEPSVIAACSFAAKLVSKSGGFSTKILDRKMIGEIALFDIEKFDVAAEKILNSREKILKVANEAYPSIVARGGGACDIEVKKLEEGNTSFLVVYLTIDVKEAMGANIINTMLEAIKPLLEEITHSKSTKSLVKANCELDVKLLGGSEVAKKIDLASKFAKIDIYRAATHNKGIFNGIDAVVIATGNDWRAIESAGNAYAVKNRRYEGLTTWTFNENTNKLNGELILPMPVASVGGSIGLNPSVKAAFHILNNPDAKTLASIIISVGLAQNLAALKALVTTGIQKGHMKLQARSLALFAGANADEVNSLVEELLKVRHMNLGVAKELLEELRKK